MFRILGAATLVAALFVLTVVGLLRAQDKDDESKLKFEIYKEKAEEFRWRLKAGNGAVLATGGQGYKAKADAKNGIESVQKAAPMRRRSSKFTRTKRKNTAGG